jgi:predicted nuclease of predicted toxin-antitoxin system
MSLALYMDEHVPAAITAALRERGVDVLTVQEDGRSGDADGALLERAALTDRIMFSQDTDLLRLAAQKQRNGEKFAGVIYAHQTSVSR